MEGRLSAFEYDHRRQKAHLWAQKLIQFPFVRQISLTGSMATGEATRRSDIDFFVQVEQGNLWWVRLAITMWVHWAGQRRTRSAVTGKLCLNWFATFDGPRAQGRPHIVLAGHKSIIGFSKSAAIENVKCQMSNVKSIPDNKTPKTEIFTFGNSALTYLSGRRVRHSEIYHSSLERWLGPFSPMLEFLARNFQYHRFINDSRTYLKNSQVRFSDTELGFHPPKYSI